MVTISPDSGFKKLKEKFRAEVGPGRQYSRTRPTSLAVDFKSQTPVKLGRDDTWIARDDTWMTGFAVYLSPEDFEHLCLILSFDETASNTRQYQEYFETVTYERRLRQDNPGVQAAWEQYQIMLAMARPNND